MKASGVVGAIEEEIQDGVLTFLESIKEKVKAGFWK